MYFIPTIVIFSHFCATFQVDFAESGLQVYAVVAAALELILIVLKTPVSLGSSLLSCAPAGGIQSWATMFYPRSLWVIEVGCSLCSCPKCLDCLFTENLLHYGLGTLSVPAPSVPGIWTIGDIPSWLGICFGEADISTKDV